MTRLGPAHVGLFLEQQSEELVRIWRLARTAARSDVFPGLLDGVLGPFFARAGELLAAGGQPTEVWRGLSGLVRWPLSVAPAEFDAEWALVEEVLSASCESVNAAPEVSAWLDGAVAVCHAGTARLGERAKPQEGILTAEGILTVLVFSSVEPPRSLRGEDETVS